MPDPTSCQLDASDGYRLRYRVWAPEGPARAVVVALNGIVSNSAWFGPLAERLVVHGVRVVGADRRGSGPNHEGRGDAPSASQLVDDVVRMVEAQPSSGPLVMVGWCWGAALAINVVAKLGARVAGLALVTPGLHPTARVQEAMAAQRDRLADAAPDEPCIDSPIADEMFTAGPALEDFIRRDPDRLHRMTPRMVDVSAKLGTMATARLRTLATPMLVLLARDDEATDNAATLAAFARLPRGGPPVVSVPARHGVQFDAPDLVVEHLLRFVDALPVPPTGHPTDG